MFCLLVSLIQLLTRGVCVVAVARVKRRLAKWTCWSPMVVVVIVSAAILITEIVCQERERDREWQKQLFLVSFVESVMTLSQLLELTFGGEMGKCIWSKVTIVKVGLTAVHVVVRREEV